MGNPDVKHWRARLKIKSSVQVQEFKHTIAREVAQIEPGGRHVAHSGGGSGGWMESRNELKTKITEFPEPTKKVTAPRTSKGKRRNRSKRCRDGDNGVWTIARSKTNDVADKDDTAKLMRANRALRREVEGEVVTRDS